MSEEVIKCVKCDCEYCYVVQEDYVCPECAHEWPKDGSSSEDEDVIRDANGVVLNNGDTVTVIKDLKIDGGSKAVKVGTKVKNIRLVNEDHDIECKIPGMGKMGLKSKFVRKV